MFDGGPFDYFSAAVFFSFECFRSACSRIIGCLGARVGIEVYGVLHFVGGPAATSVNWNSCWAYLRRIFTAGCRAAVFRGDMSPRAGFWDGLSGQGILGGFVVSFVDDVGAWGYFRCEVMMVMAVGLVLIGGDVVVDGLFSSW